MELSYIKEALVFLITLLGGMVIGVVFDIYRVIKDATYKNVVFYTLSDLIVWIVLSILAFETVFIANSGSVRWFEIIALLVGYILYTVTISKYFLKLLRILIRLLKNIIMLIIKPLIILFNIIKKPFCFMFSWLKVQKNKLKFIKNKQKLKIKQINRIFRKN